MREEDFAVFAGLRVGLPDFLGQAAAIDLGQLHRAVTVVVAENVPDLAGLRAFQHHGGVA